MDELHLVQSDRYHGNGEVKPSEYHFSVHVKKRRSQRPRTALERQRFALLSEDGALHAKPGVRRSALFGPRGLVFLPAETTLPGVVSAFEIFLAGHVYAWTMYLVEVAIVRQVFGHVLAVSGDGSLEPSNFLPQANFGFFSQLPGRRHFVDVVPHEDVGVQFPAWPRLDFYEVGCCVLEETNERPA